MNVLTKEQSKTVEALKSGCRTVPEICTFIGESSYLVSNRISVLRKKGFVKMLDKVDGYYNYKLVPGEYKVDDGTLPLIVKQSHADVLEHVKSGLNSTKLLLEHGIGGKNVGCVLYGLERRGLLSKTAKNRREHWYHCTGREYVIGRSEHDNSKPDKVVSYAACDMLIWRAA